MNVWSLVELAVVWLGPSAASAAFFLCFPTYHKRALLLAAVTLPAVVMGVWLVAPVTDTVDARWRYRQVRDGMAEEAVQEVLGGSGHYCPPGSFTGTPAWSGRVWELDEETVIVVFDEDGKVVQKDRTGCAHSRSLRDPGERLRAKIRYLIRWWL